MSRTRNSFRNMKYGLFFQEAITVLTFFSRRVFVQVLSEEYLGLNGTFSNILSMLSVMEMGVGSLITYCLYKPLADGDEEQIISLLTLLRRVYWIVGAMIAILGGILTPFLPMLIHEIPDVPHIYLIYLLFVANSAISYLYSYKGTLFIADQKSYIIMTYSYVIEALRLVCQILFLWYTRNYFFYISFNLIGTLLKNLLVSYQADRNYPFLRGRKSRGLKPEIKKSIVRNIKAKIIHTLASAVVDGTDNLLIAYFVGAVSVGLYSNYLTIIGGVEKVYQMIYQSITASVGNLLATETPEKALTVYKRINFAGNWIYGFSAVCLVVLFNPFIELWVGEQYQLKQTIVCLIVLNYYVKGMRKVTLLFMGAYGLYWYDRYKAVAEMVINLVFSIGLAVPYGMTGIFMGTFISTMTTCFWVEPLVLFRHGLHASVSIYFKEYGLNALVTLLTAVIVWSMCMALPGEGVLLFLGKMAICVVIGNGGYLVAYCKRNELRYFVDLATRVLIKKRRRG